MDFNFGQLIIFSLALFGWTFILESCTNAINDEETQQPVVWVTDEIGQHFKIIKIEGCEYYQTKYGLTKVDCDCHPIR